MGPSPPVHRCVPQDWRMHISFFAKSFSTVEWQTALIAISLRMMHSKYTRHRVRWIRKIGWFSAIGGTSKHVFDRVFESCFRSLRKYTCVTQKWFRLIFVNLDRLFVTWRVPKLGLCVGAHGSAGTREDFKSGLACRTWSRPGFIKSKNPQKPENC